MRQALTLALNHTTTRSAFGSSIAERPMMTNVLADMAVEVEAATLMALRVAKATDLMATSEHEKLLARVATPAAKFFNCSRAPSIANEALQCHGGNGFIEENPMARSADGSAIPTSTGDPSKRGADSVNISWPRSAVMPTATLKISVPWAIRPP